MPWDQIKTYSTEERGAAPPNEIISKLRGLHGTAAPQPDQGKRTPDYGEGGTNSLEGRHTMEKK